MLHFSASMAGLALVLAGPAHADDARLLNRGNDPFLVVSTAFPGCPEPAGPRVDEAEWRRESHHRTEEGNHCWLEGRCRLPNAYQYDKDIADSVQRRLRTLDTLLPGWRASSSLWLTVRGRWLVLQGCAGKGFPRAGVLKALGEVEDVERVVDQVGADPSKGVPYPLYRPR